MNILGIETSCDETAAAVVTDAGDVLSNIVFSQTELHAPYGGVVPEIASRSHLVNFPAVVEQALAKAGLGWDRIEAVAATYGPGLASSLLVGLTAGRALAMRLARPFIAVNHLEAHLYAPFLSKNMPEFSLLCPFIALIVSGGHTCLVKVEALGRYRLLGTTLDDAAGECFDKGAKLLGLGYPGGPEINRLAFQGDKTALSFPRGKISSTAGTGGLNAGLCFSFSGLKTALMYYLKSSTVDTRRPVADIAASYQEAVVDALCDRLMLAARQEGAKCVMAGGGVSINTRLREKTSAAAEASGLQVFFAEPEYCLDNAAMVAGLAGAGQGIKGDQAWNLDVNPNLKIGTEWKGKTKWCARINL